MEPFVSKYQCDFRQGHSARMIPNLSEAFDCLPHELLLDKLHVYRFVMAGLRLVYRHLTNRKQRTEKNSVYSSWEGISLGFHRDLSLTLCFLIFFYGTYLL